MVALSAREDILRMQAEALICEAGSRDGPG